MLLCTHAVNISEPASFPPQMTYCLISKLEFSHPRLAWSLYANVGTLTCTSFCAAYAGACEQCHL